MGTNRVFLMRAAELDRSKAPGFGGIQPAAQLGAQQTSGHRIASRQRDLPKPGTPQITQDLAYPAVGPLFNKGSRDPAGEKARLPGPICPFFSPEGPSGLVGREMLI